MKLFCISLFCRVILLIMILLIIMIMLCLCPPYSFSVVFWFLCMPSVFSLLYWTHLRWVYQLLLYCLFLINLFNFYISNLVVSWGGLAWYPYFVSPQQAWAFLDGVGLGLVFAVLWSSLEFPAIVCGSAYSMCTRGEDVSRWCQLVAEHAGLGGKKAGLCQLLSDWVNTRGKKLIVIISDGPNTPGFGWHQNSRTCQLY